MRAFIVGTAILLAAWLLYLAAPYWALWRLGGALDAGDGGAVLEHVNVRALRLSLAHQIAAEALPRSTTAAKDPDAELAAAALVAAADQFLDQILTPERLSELLLSLRHEAGSARPEPVRFRPSIRSAADLGGLVLASRWRGFRNVYIAWPPGAPAGTQPRAQLRFSRFAWRLTAIDLPPETRRRLAEDVARRVGRSLPK